MYIKLKFIKLSYCCSQFRDVGQKDICSLWHLWHLIHQTDGNHAAHLTQSRDSSLFSATFRANLSFLCQSLGFCECVGMLSYIVHEIKRETFFRRVQWGNNRYCTQKPPSYTEMWAVMQNGGSKSTQSVHVHVSCGNVWTQLKPL